MSLVDEFLEHHGVKGQKWGIRRNRSTSSAKSSGEKIVSPDATRSTYVEELIRRHGTQAVSNEDLKLVTTRAELNVKYQKYYPPKQSKKKRAARWVLSLLASEGEKQVKAVLAEVATGQRVKLSTKLPAGK